MLLAISNQGNHNGHNRRWDVCYTDQTDLMFIAERVSDNHTFYESAEEFRDVFKKTDRWAKWEGAGYYDSSGNFEAGSGTTAYEHDFIYYYLYDEDVDLEDIPNDGHHAGLRTRIAELIGR